MHLTQRFSWGLAPSKSKGTVWVKLVLQDRRKGPTGLQPAHVNSSSLLIVT